MSKKQNVSQTSESEIPVSVSSDGTAVAAPKRGFWHKIFGSTPGDGEMQPKEALSFSICGFGQNLICTIVGSYLTVFMTDAIGFSALSVALLMLFARIYDAANDPIMGSIVDRTRTRWGKCRPYLKWMAIPIMLMTILCFLPWYPNNPGGFAAVTIVYLIWGMVYTVADVPYWGLSTAMSNDTYRRGNMLTVARLFCTLGAGLVTIIVPMITSNMTAGLAPDAAAGKLRYIYFIAAIVCCAIALPLFFLGFKNTQERNQSLEAPPSLKHNLKLLFKNKPLMLIVLSGIGGAARMLFTYTGGLYFAKYVMADVGFTIIPNVVEFRGEALYTVFTMAIVPGGLIASLLVPYFTKKVGKRNTYIWSHIIGGVAMLIAFLVPYMCGDQGKYTSAATLACLIVALVIAGVPTGFGNIVTYAMIGDTVEYLELKTGERAEGICFAMQTLINKIGMAVGAFVGVLAYYLADVKANDPSQLTPANKDTMWIILMLVATISFFLTVIPLFFYKFNEKEQQEAVAEIKRRKEAAANANGENLDAGETEQLAGEGFAPTVILPNESNQPVPEETEEGENAAPESDLGDISEKEAEDEPKADAPAEEAPKDEE